MRLTPERLEWLRHGPIWPINIIAAGYVDEIFIEVDGLQDEVNKLQAGNVLTCVYCGHAYPPGSPDHGAEVLTTHIKVCPKHPMGVVMRENETLKSMLDRLCEIVTFDLTPGDVQDRMLRVIHQGEVPA